MSLTIYEATIPVLIRMLNSLSAIIDKAENYAEQKKIEPSVLLNARLAPDMYPLLRQIQIATDAAKGCAGRLAKIELPIFEDNELSFMELKQRISKTVEFLQSISSSQLQGSEDSTITLKIRGNEISFKGDDYAMNFALPNFYFHVTMAYAILRHNGLDVGKRDFLGAL